MTAPKPIVAPGPTPHGPPGWEEKQQERLSSGQLTNEKQSSNFHDDAIVDHNRDTGFQTISHETSDSSSSIKKSTDSEQQQQHHKGLSKVKDQLHHIGEKMALVPPTEKDEHGNALERSAHRQVSNFPRIHLAYSSSNSIHFRMHRQCQSNVLGSISFTVIKSRTMICTHASFKCDKALESNLKSN